MARWVRWVVAVIVPVVLFGVAAWAARVAPWSWLPSAEADRWVVAVGFATVVAAAVGGGTAWWAAREQPTEPAPLRVQATKVVQRARASGNAHITQIGCDQNNRRG